METQQKISPYEMEQIVSYVNTTVEDAIGKAGWDTVKHMIAYRYHINPETSDILEKRDIFRAAIHATLGTSVLAVVDRVLLETLGRRSIPHRYTAYPI